MKTLSRTLVVLLLAIAPIILGMLWNKIWLEDSCPGKVKITRIFLTRSGEAAWDLVLYDMWVTLYAIEDIFIILLRRKCSGHEK